MHAELKSYFSSDLNEPDLPSDIYDCEVWVEATIGTSGHDGGDIFQFGFVTPKYLERSITDADYRYGKGLIIIEAFYWAKVKSTLDKFIQSSQGESWQEIAIKLSRYGLWEFEDYQEYQEDQEET